MTMRKSNKYTFVQAVTGLTVTVMSTDKDSAISKLGYEIGFKNKELPPEWRLAKIDVR